MIEFNKEVANSREIQLLFHSSYLMRNVLSNKKLNFDRMKAWEINNE